MHDKLAFYLLKTPVRVVVLVLWVVYICVSVYGLTILKVDFKQEFFISKKSQTA